MFLFRILIAVALSIAVSLTAIAEEDEKTKKQKAEKFLSIGVPKGLELNISEEDKKGTFGANFVKGDDIYGLSITGKLEDNVGEFINLDGIDSNTKVTGSYSRMFVANRLPVNDLVKFTFHKDAPKIAISSLIECNRLVTSMIDNPPPEGLKISKINCEKQTELVQKLSNGLIFDKAIAGNMNLVATKILSELKTLPLNAYNIEKSIGIAKELIDATIENQSHIESVIKDFGTFNISASYFQSKFNWVDVEHISSSSDRAKNSTEDGFDISLGYAHTYFGANWKWEAGLKFQKGYANASANTKRELCFKYEADNDISECISGFLLPPLEKKTIEPFFKVTKLFSEKSIVKAIGVDMKYTFEDAEKQDGTDGGLDRFTIEVPFHLVSLFDKKLSAGVKPSWVSDVKSKEDPFKLVFFISAPLTF
jgi:hypothetical protein